MVVMVSIRGGSKKQGALASAIEDGSATSTFVKVFLADSVATGIGSSVCLLATLSSVATDWDYARSMVSVVFTCTAALLTTLVFILRFYNEAGSALLRYVEVSFIVWFCLHSSE